MKSHCPHPTPGCQVDPENGSGTGRFCQTPAGRDLITQPEDRQRARRPGGCLAQQLRLCVVQCARNARVAVGRRSEQGEVAEGVNRRFRDHERGVLFRSSAQPQTLFTTRREPGEGVVLQLVPADPLAIPVGKHGVAPSIRADAAGKARVTENVGRNGAFVLQVGMMAANGPHRLETIADPFEVSRSERTQGRQAGFCVAGPTPATAPRTAEHRCLGGFPTPARGKVLAGAS